MRKTPFAAAAFAVLALAAAPAVAQPASGYGWPVDLVQAKRAAAAASAKATELGVAMAIAVVEPSGELVYFEKMPGTSYGAVRVAIAKARAAAMFKMDTKRMQDLSVNGPNFADLPDGLPLEGGVPLMSEGRVIGGVGTSGAAPAVDGQVTAAGVAAVK